jgi:hypothetical protein
MNPMSTKRLLRSAFLVTAGLWMLHNSAPQADAQAFSAQITGAATWQKGSAYSVTWSFTGTPPALVTQYGVKVVAVSMNGASMTYMLTL